MQEKKNYFGKFANPPFFHITGSVIGYYFEVKEIENE
jgi:hypothetical protein